MTSDKLTKTLNHLDTEINDLGKTLEGFKTQNSFTNLVNQTLASSPRIASPEQINCKTEPSTPRAEDLKQTKEEPQPQLSHAFLGSFCEKLNNSAKTAVPLSSRSTRSEAFDHLSRRARDEARSQ